MAPQVLQVSHECDIACNSLLRSAKDSEIKPTHLINDQILAVGQPSSQATTGKTGIICAKYDYCQPRYTMCNDLCTLFCV